MLLERKRMLACVICSLGLAISASAEVLLETASFAVRIDDAGAVIGLLDRGNGVNYQAPDQAAPLVSIRSAWQIHFPETMLYEESKKTLTLQYSEDTTVVVKTATKATHVTFEVVSVEPKEAVELVVWGPYPTQIKEIIGETVGVVRNDRFALGLQALNVRTLGGYPTVENDVMAGRGDTALPKAFGSVLQAFTRDRSRDRVISNWAHENYHVPAYDDGGVVGSKIALFGCAASEALKTIGEIEVAEGLPHPMIDGVWGKVSPGATAAYLIVGFGEDTIDEAIAATSGPEILVSRGAVFHLGTFSAQSKSVSQRLGGHEALCGESQGSRDSVGRPYPLEFHHHQRSLCYARPG